MRLIWFNHLTFDRSGVQERRCKVILVLRNGGILYKRGNDGWEHQRDATIQYYH